MLKSQRNFSVVEIVILVLVIILFGFVGWTVWQANQATAPTTLQTAEVPAGEEEQAEENTIPEGWAEYRNEELGFSFAYPEEWGEATVGDGGPNAELKSFVVNFSASDVAVGAIAKDYMQKTAELGAGRGGAMHDFQGFEERDGQFYLVHYDKDMQRQVRDERMDGYVRLQGVNTDVLLNTSLSFFESSMTHLMFNLDDDEFPAMNIYVDASNSDSTALSDVAASVRVF